MKSRREQPKSCPECGGDLKWNGLQKVYTCTSCGLEITADELRSYHVKKEKTDRIKEYVDWWFSKKE